MLQAALEVSGAIDTYSKTWLNDLRDDYLEIKDWKSLREIADFLQPFHRATLETQGLGGTLDRVLWTMDIITKHYGNSLKRFSKSLRPQITRSWEVFDKYYAKTDLVPVYAAALILHPSNRLEYITRNWRKEWHQLAITGVKEIWESYRERGVVTNTPVLSEASNLDEFDKIAQELKAQDQDDDDEFERYSRERRIAIQTSALDWWLAEERRTAWPRLSQMAIDILSIPAMSDEPERVFSGARRTISWDRMQLGASNIEKTQCLKSWLASGLISDEGGAGLTGV